MSKNTIIKSLVALTVMTTLATTTNGITDLKQSHLVAQAEETNVVPPKREVVKNSLHSPYNIVTKIQGPGFSASGFVSGKTTVMTNKHVLDSILKEGTLKTDVILAKNDANEGDKKDLGTFKIKDYTLAPDNMDVVVLEMNPNEKGQHIGDVVQPAKIKNADEINQTWIDNNKDKKFFTAGYPGDKDLNKMWHSEGHLLFL
ncbi:trypsin-like serine protease [Staphylococcus aureus]|uniref:trypsin-like serine protease n=1 Tax=Staphylococcus aureus TaxID=1280 RepID=UPI000DFBF21D|nr:trypsin-like serine protease [Staphylococcus aureus]SUK08326.1 glutamyl endopeptidase precursor [Staphylococcus aureus]